jgi:hypothetical protein
MPAAERVIGLLIGFSVNPISSAFLLGPSAVCKLAGAKTIGEPGLTRRLKMQQPSRVLFLIPP